MSDVVEIHRHRSAMRRAGLSRPMATAVADEVVRNDRTVFDYGCGRGDDLRHLDSMGVPAAGWDPTFAPNTPLAPADIVNLGYVVNVIEHLAEREGALKEAWGLARCALVVAARLEWEMRPLNGLSHSDGLVTSKGTFQKFYRQEELRAWIDATLQVRSVAAAPGIFYVFRDPGESERLLAQRARRDNPPSAIRIVDLLFEQHRDCLEPLRQFVAAYRRLPGPLELAQAPQLTDVFGSVRSAFLVVRRVTGRDGWADVNIGDSASNAERRFADHQEVLQPLLEFLESRGRLPHPDELSNEADLCAALGSIRRAFALVRHVTGDVRWEELAARRREDFLVYLALSAFGGRPRYGSLPVDLQYDAREFFGNYRAACKEADALLFAAGDHVARDQACKGAPIGKLTPEALYVHVGDLGRLPPVLRVYEGCARTLSGKVEEANILKLHRLKAQVSYLSYPSFDLDPHPALESVVVSRLSRLDVTYRDFRGSENPPVLHRKETFVSPAYPHHGKFARLTEQEERHGLLEDAATIGTRVGWGERLVAHGWRLSGHRLIRSGSGQ